MFSNILDYNFFQFVDRPTWNANLLDLVFTNSPELLLSIDSGFHLQDVGLPSDHYPVIFDIAASVKVRNFDQRFRLNFSKANFDILNNNFTLLPLGCGINTIKSQEELDMHWEFWCDLDLLQPLMNLYLKWNVAILISHLGFLKILPKQLRKRKLYGKKSEKPLMFCSEKSSVKSVKESRIGIIVLRESAFFTTLLMRPTLTPRNSGPFFLSRIEKSLFLTPLFMKARNTALIVWKLKHFFVFSNLSTLITAHVFPLQ